jgi:hypothetical protein
VVKVFARAVDRFHIGMRLNTLWDVAWKIQVERKKARFAKAS